MSWEKKKSACCDQEHPSGLAGWGQQGIRTQEGLDGLASVPGSFFCGTVVPASQPSNPQCNPAIRNIGGQWFCWFISEVPGF